MSGEEEEKGQKEIQLVDPLYEPVIMYPLKDLPIDNEDIGRYEEEYKTKYESPHYQKLVRIRWRKKFLGELVGSEKRNLLEIINTEENKLEKINLVKAIRIAKREKRNKVENCKITITKGKDIVEKKVEEVIKERTVGDRCIYPDDESVKIKDTFYDYKEFGSEIALKELYDLYSELINTFEMQRLMHLQMTGFLSYKYPSSTPVSPKEDGSHGR